MLVVAKDKGFRLDYMDENDLQSLRNMIACANLPERRHWNNILEEINSICR